MTERAFVRSLRRVGLTEVTVRERRLFGVDDCARYPLFTPDLIATMRRTIAPDRQPQVATCVTVTAVKSSEDAPAGDLIASRGAGNARSADGVSTGMGEYVPTFDIGDRGCGEGIGRELRAWWAGLPSGSRARVLLRDPSAKSDVPSLARLLGHTVEEESESDGVMTLTVRRKGD